MRTAALGLVAVGTIGVASVTAIAAWPIGSPPQEIALEGDVDRGAYLARASGCIACHTDFENGGAPLSGGVKLDTPFGALYSPNLTTDLDQGIGSWTLAEFDKAVRQGISPEGEPYYPAFTYAFYQNFSDQDIADLWAAFQTVSPAAQPSKEPEMSFPFNQRALLKIWRALFLDLPRTEPVPVNSDTWNRGRLLVEGAAHCGACHTGRNILGGRKVDTEHFKGSDMLPGGGKAPAIDYQILMTRGWDVENLAYALRTGVTPSGDAFGNAMGEVVLYGTQFLSEEDRIAIATYLMDDHG